MEREEGAVVTKIEERLGRTKVRALARELLQ
jgi:hypothetical protein